MPRSGDKMRLSEHFTLEELIYSYTATRKNIDNTPNSTQVQNLRDLVVHVLQPIRHEYGKPININSGFRSRGLNIAIGGSPTSDHVQGRAADIRAASNKNLLYAILKLYKKKKIEFDQCIIEFPVDDNPSWIHISYKKHGNRNQILQAKKNETGDTEYTIVEV